MEIKQNKKKIRQISTINLYSRNKENVQDYQEIKLWERVI